jgi:hypothetical protein
VKLVILAGLADFVDIHLTYSINFLNIGTELNIDIWVYSICMASMQQGARLSSLLESKGDHHSKWSPFWSWT